MIEILLATNNDNKRKEIRSLLKEYKEVRIINFTDLNVSPPIIIEDGKTFRQNAVKKAVITSKFFDGLVLADDSGLSVEALHGKPGVRSARFARINATDEENNRKLLNLLAKIPEKKRKAEFVCHLALAKKGQLIESVEAVVKGEIADEPKGKKGFGYDPLFIPKKYKKTFAEMSQSDKNQISHRGIALKMMKIVIGKYLKKSS